jgi:hypothetical protein
VYCLSNNCSNNGVESCFRRSQNGIIQIERPKVIGEYNKYMGGVDLADMRRLHCNSTINGQKRWWLKLFFYLLDVETSNSHILYRLAMSNTDKSSTTLVEFKIMVINVLVGSRITEIPGAVNISHELVHSTQRHSCAYCALFSKKKRTRYRCRAPGCNLPLCSIGTGKSDRDCFTLSHANEEIRFATMKKYEVMQMRTNYDKQFYY